MNRILDIFALISVLLFIITFVINKKLALSLGLLFKPLIDTAWDVNIGFLSLIELFSVLYLLLAYSFYYREIHSTSKLWITLLWLIAHIGILWSFFITPIEGLKSFSKFLYLPMAFWLLPKLILKSSSNFVVLTLRFLILGSLFSSIISILQYVNVIPYEFVHQSKGLQRANGFYHDMVTSRIYVMQGLMTLSYIYFTKKFYISTRFLFVLTFIFLFSAYTLFSKALIGIIVVSFIVLIITEKLRLYVYVLVTLSMLLLLTNSNLVSETTSKLFAEEIIYTNSVHSNSDKVFAGRGMLWSEYIQDFFEAPVYKRFFGFGVNDGRTHNEFLRSLILSGYIGLMSFALFMSIIVVKIYNNFMSNSMRFTSVFLLIIILIDSIGVVWGLYPFYILIFFGFFSVLTYRNKYELNEATYAKIRVW